MSRKDEKIPTVSGIRRNPYDKPALLLKGNGFLPNSPLGALNIAKGILGYEPEEVEAWIMLFKAASLLEKKKKPNFWAAKIEFFLPKVKRVRNWQNAVEILANHPTNIELWKQLCDIAINTGNPHMEEMIRRTIFECDRKNTQSMADLADLLCRKAQLFADAKAKRACFDDAIYLLKEACKIKKGDLSLSKKLTDIYALSSLSGWETLRDEGGTYQGLVVTDKWPTV